MPAQGPTRRLAAILSADAVGFTRLMAADEAATVQMIVNRRGAIEALVNGHGGRIVDSPGDNVLAEFPSARDATLCAVEIQRELAVRNEREPPDRRMAFRIGLHLGDVIVEGGRIYGEGVNVAARLEGIASPGGICASEDLYRQVRNSVDLPFSAVEKVALKNMPDPVSAYHIQGLPGSDAGGPTGTTDGNVLARPAVAVLPFENVGGEPDQEYFADGITEDVITSLSSWRCFPVIARNSTFAFKGKTIDVRQLGHELGARYVVEGSVRKSGSRVRVSAQLIDATLGHQLWADRYDRNLSDAFEVQNEISLSIVASVEPELSRAEEHRAFRAEHRDGNAWDLGLRALWHLRRFGAGDFETARELLDQARIVDPQSSYLASLTGLCQFNKALLGWTADPPNAFREVYEAATRAVELDDRDWLAHALLGIALLWTHRDYDRAIEEEEKAIGLNPSASISYQFLGCVLEFSGRAEEAIPRFEAVLRLDPRFQGRSAVLADLSLSHLLCRNRELAVDFAERAVREGDHNVRARQRLVVSLAHGGRVVAARGALRELLDSQPDFSLKYVDATYPFRDSADREFFLEGLRAAGWRESAAAASGFDI
jgi:adenylate cyclase